MPDRIVVPVDGSQRSLEAVRAGSLLARDREATLEVVTVVAPHADLVAERQALDEQLHHLGEAAEGAVATVLAGGDPAELLAGHAGATPDTLLVMSSTGRGRSAAVLGSVTARLLSAELGPVLIIGPNASAHRLLAGDVVVTLDGSRFGEHALDVAAQWCRGGSNRVWVVAVVTTAAGAQVDVDVAESGYVHSRAEQLGRNVGYEVEYEVLHGGSPARAVVEYAEAIDAGLIVMSTHGRGGLRRLVLGSVVADVIRHSPCPVLVERPAEVSSPAGPDVVREPAKS